MEALKGTEKQVVYANDLRNKRIREIEERIETAERTKKMRIEKNKSTQRQDDEIRIRKIEIEVLNNFSGSASTIIDAIKYQVWDKVLPGYKKIWNEILGSFVSEWCEYWGE